MHEEKSSVYCLPVHLQDQQTIYFGDNNDLDEVVEHDAIKKTALMEWFTANQTFPAAKQVSYLDFPITLCGTRRTESGVHASKVMLLEGCALFTDLEEKGFILGCC